MWSKFSSHNLLSLVLKDQKPFLSLTGRVPLTEGNIPKETTVCSSKGQALQFASGLDFLSIQAWRLWMEHPSRRKVKAARLHSDDTQVIVLSFPFSRVDDDVYSAVERA